MLRSRVATRRAPLGGDGRFPPRFTLEVTTPPSPAASCRSGARSPPLSSGERAMVQERSPNPVEDRAEAQREDRRRRTAPTSSRRPWASSRSTRRRRHRRALVLRGGRPPSTRQPPRHRVHATTACRRSISAGPSSASGLGSIALRRCCRRPLVLSSSADAAGMGRRTRSSPRPGKPVTWRRGPACSQHPC